ncbi:hypothetical protein JAO78_005060 [Alishewanella sp. 16-MA]|uniref:Peptidase C51 domain-containing protein n=1 Tax=Alishewanella maricola TaxID=2795740 RepID=A0ABS8C1I8_9ALTE|nr:hypothetical protein [Alishewanella maricola]MCB5226180.1 hypothetical protein [Alishewanella maricola]
MASFPVTVYRWDDSGAPQITDGLASEYLNVLHKCLVEGYGSKLPLGWTRPFHNATSHISVYRNNTNAGGSGSCVRFSREGANSPFGIIRTTYAVDMTAINTYVKRGFTQGFSTLSGVSSGYEPIKWIMVGTVTAFYFFAADVFAQKVQQQNANGVGFFAGDIFSTIPNDIGRFIAGGSASGDNTLGNNWFDHIHYTLYSAAIPTPSANVFRIYSADNHNSSAFYGLYPGLPCLGNGPSSGESYLANAPLSTQLSAPVLLVRPNELPGNSTTKDRLGIPITNSTITPYLRGVMPGMKIALYTGYRDQNWGHVAVIDGVDHLIVPQTTTGGSNVVIELGSWHDPFN